ncbi:transcription elongation factor GreA/GreB, N-terminal domain protein [Porphyromonas gingivalis W50]|nr:transcription elongation factor GreA/GreB, N-terminal domain protein [Porphyromonas gingivalis W50]
MLKRLKERVESSGDIPYIWVSSGLLFSLWTRMAVRCSPKKNFFFNQRYIQDSMAYNYITQEGYDKILAELAELESVQRPEISRQIAEARDKGDLSENAEYDAAKEAQGILETKIAQLKGLIANARIIDESQVSTESVQILNKVTIKNVKTGVVMAYTLVSDSEANLKENKISVNTPIAQGLMGKKIGDLVSIKVPSGLVEFEIIDITL